MAHSVRPDSYMEIANFYTVTIYEKGAEVVRMINLLLGPEAFRAGSDLYFDRHDGQAVTTEDFIAAMEDSSGKDLTQFRLWYSQAGTPRLSVSGEFDTSAKTYTLTVQQTCPATPGQSNKQPMVIPLRLGLLDSQGQEIPLQLTGEDDATAASTSRSGSHAATTIFHVCECVREACSFIVKKFQRAGQARLSIHAGRTGFSDSA